jgi:hypothetical protein
VRQSVEPRFSAEYDKLQAELRKVLTPEQFARWQVRFNEARRRWLPPAHPPGPGRGGGFGPGGPGGPGEWGGPPGLDGPRRGRPPMDGGPDSEPSGPP